MIQSRVKRSLWLELRIVFVSLIALLLNIAHTLQATSLISYNIDA